MVDLRVVLPVDELKLKEMATLYHVLAVKLDTKVLTLSLFA
jgi:hypothetical protein